MLALFVSLELQYNERMLDEGLVDEAQIDGQIDKSLANVPRLQEDPGYRMVLKAMLESGQGSEQNLPAKD